jgi:hypothetical protein
MKLMLFCVILLKDIFADIIVTRFGDIDKNITDSPVVRINYIPPPIVASIDSIQSNILII